jgi:hypothetical protein
MDHIEIEFMDWMHLPQERDQWRVHVNTVMGLRIPTTEKFLIIWLAVSFSAVTLLHVVS